MRPTHNQKSKRKSIRYTGVSSQFLRLGGHAILDFCNTKVIHSDSIEDRLLNLDQMQSFFLEILHETTKINESDYAELIEFREMTRTLLESFVDGHDPNKKLKALNTLLSKHLFSPSVQPDPSSGFRIDWKSSKTNKAPLDLIILRLIEFLATSQTDRMKKCGNPNCSHLFYDSSKNNSRNWCSMSSCGNIMKARAFYARSKLVLVPMTFLILSVLSSLSFTTAFAKTIQISGNERSTRTIIETEVALSNPQTPESIQQNLLRTGLFSEAQVVEDSESIQVKVVEKWTTIPILKYNSGGGVSQSIFGVYDPNIGGQRIELGYQHERLEKAPSHVGWLKIPRLRESRYFLDFNIGTPIAFDLNTTPIRMTPT